MHNGFLNIDNHKMSKSANNFFTVRELSEVYGYEPIRYFLLTGQYRGPLNYTAELIGACKASLERLYTCRNNLDFAIENAHGDDETLVEKAAAARGKFCAAMDDDLNTPDAVSYTHLDVYKRQKYNSIAWSKLQKNKTRKVFSN